MRTGGIKDGSGSIEGIYDPTNPLPTQFDVGASITLDLYLTAIGHYHVPCVIQTLKFNVDIDTGDYVTWTADFETNGAWTNPGSGELAGPEGQPEHFDDPVVSELMKKHMQFPSQKPAEPKKAVAELVAEEVAKVKEEMILAFKDLLRESRPESVSQAA